jgi:hypothetical protein
MLLSPLTIKQYVTYGVSQIDSGNYLKVAGWDWDHPAKQQPVLQSSGTYKFAIRLALFSGNTIDSFLHLMNHCFTAVKWNNKDVLSVVCQHNSHNTTLSQWL